MTIERKILYRSIIFVTLCSNVVQIFLTYIVRIDFEAEYRSAFQLFCDYVRTFLGVLIFIILRKLFKMYMKNRSFVKLIKITRISDKYSYLLKRTEIFIGDEVKERMS